MASARQKIGDVIGRIPNPFRKPGLPEPYATGYDTQGNPVIVPGGEMEKELPTGWYPIPTGSGVGSRTSSEEYNRYLEGRDKPSGYEGWSPTFRANWEAEQKILREAEANRLANLPKPNQPQRTNLTQTNLTQTNLRDKNLSNSNSYRTKDGIVSADTLAKRNQERADQRIANKKEYYDYKRTESIYLADIEKKAYNTYKNLGDTDVQARYRASQWRKATVEDIKASGGITTYSTQGTGSSTPTIMSLDTYQSNLEASQRGNKGAIDVSRGVTIQLTKDQENNLVVSAQAGSSYSKEILDKYYSGQIDIQTSAEPKIETKLPTKEMGKLPSNIFNLIDEQKLANEKKLKGTERYDLIGNVINKVSPSVNYEVNKRIEKAKNIFGFGMATAGIVQEKINPYVSKSINTISPFINYEINKRIDKTKDIIRFGYGSVSELNKRVSPFISYGINKNIEDTKRKLETTKNISNLGLETSKEVGKTITPYVAYAINREIDTNKKRINQAGDIFNLGSNVVKTSVEKSKPYVSYFINQEARKVNEKINNVKNLAMFGAGTIYEGQKFITPYIQKASPFINYEINKKLEGTKNKINFGMDIIKGSSQAITPYTSYLLNQELNKINKKVETAKNIFGLGMMGVTYLHGDRKGLWQIGTENTKQQFNHEPTGIKVQQLLSEFNNATTREEQYNIKFKLKSLGVDIFKSEKLGGGQEWDIHYPKWYRELRPDFETKTQRETVIPYLIRTGGYKTQEAFSNIFQGTVYKNQPYFGIEPTHLTKTAKQFGSGVALASELGLYSLPIIGTTAFLGGTAEALSRGKGFIQYAKENPWDVGLAGGYAGVQAFRGIRALKNLERIKNPKIVEKIIKPKVVGRSLSIDDTLYRGNVLGKETYSSKGKIVSRVKYPSGRVYTIQTDITGNLITTPLEEGALGFVSKNIAEQVKSGGIKVFKDKVTKKIYLYSAESEGRLVQSNELDNIFTGTSQSKVKNVGEIKSKGTPDNTISIRTIKKRNPQVSEGISNLKAQTVKQFQDVKWFGNKIKVGVPGERTTSKSLSVTDIYSDVKNAKIGEKPDRDITGGLSSVFKPNPPEEAVKVFEGGKAKSSNEFIQNLYVEQKQFPVSEIFKSDVESISKVIKADLEQPRIIKTVIPQEIKPIPNLSPALIPGESINKFQDMTGVSSFADQTKSKFGNLGVSSTRFNLGLGTGERTNEQSKERQIEIAKPSELEKTGFNLGSGLSTSPMEKQAQKERQQQKTKLSQQQTQEQKSIQILRSSQQSIQKQKEREKPKKVPITFKFPSSQLQRIERKIREEPELFKIFATKGGKNIERGTFKSQREAELGLKNILKKELRAGGFVTKGNKPLKASELREFFGGEFRLSKASPYKIIQKKERRLTRGGSDVREISYFKKGKKSKSISLFS